MASPYSTEAMTRSDEGDVAVLTYSPLDIGSIIAAVSSPEAGAIATFLGQTRNNFDTKVVTHLEYEAYSALAIKTMATVLQRARTRSQTPLTRLAIYHRLGECPVGTTSIVVAVSSPHRAEAFEACSWIVDEVKRRAQIFKREYYEGLSEAEAAWKRN
ncbi:related to molybdopterin synthase large subunit [Serendipita indica DSM 11827]|uniref:Related to molybdopterin synthase large subunit n=1 Tax=Serendipita indica (strain DSM 11827) TaxID=1109443 RepID=G4TCS2_SERID|nr:related to molybdopterin synthase large subunit [Serendipita indica DSM 11827]